MQPRLSHLLAEESDVAVRIYSVSSQLMRTLDLGRKVAGSYANKDKAIHWDGRNDSGEKLASGVYFYVMHAGRFSASRKMLLAQ